MESGIAVHPLASTEPHSPLERPGVALETRDGGVVENLRTDSAVAKGGENHPPRVPESDSPDKPDTPPSRLSLDQLRAEIDAAVGTLPEILRVCTVEALTERVAPVFQDADHARSPSLGAFLDSALGAESFSSAKSQEQSSSRAPARWEALRSALARTSPSRRAEDLASFHEAACHVERRIRAADAPTPVDADEAYAVSAPLGVGLVACGECGRVLAREALRRHKAATCARVAAALGERGVAARLREVKGALGSLEKKTDATFVEDENEEATAKEPLLALSSRSAKPAPAAKQKTAAKNVRAPKEKEKAEPPPPSPPRPLVPKEKRSKKPRKARADLDTRTRGHADALAREAREVTFGGHGFPGFPAHFSGWNVSPGTGLGPPGMAAGTGTGASGPQGYFPGYPQDGFHPHVHPQHAHPQHGVPVQHVPQQAPNHDLQHLLRLQREHASRAFHQDAARFFPGQPVPQQYFPTAGAFPGYPVGAVAVGVGVQTPTRVAPLGVSPSGSHPGSPRGIPPGSPAAPGARFADGVSFDADFGTRLDGGKRRRGDEMPSLHPSAHAHHMHAQQQMHMQQQMHVQQMRMHQLQQVRRPNDDRPPSGGNA